MEKQPYDTARFYKTDFQEEPYMHEYEIFIEEINPCGGEKHSKKTLIEAEAVSPEAYVKENGRFPVLGIHVQ